MLFHVAFQHVQQFAKIALAFLGVGSATDAFVKMFLNDNAGKRFEGLARGHHLHQHFRAIAIVADHFFNGGDLAGQLAQPELEGAFFLRRMDVGVRSHEATLQESGNQGQN